MPSIVMTLIGPDHPGLVESLANAIAEQGANWMESRMAHLGGQFAGILRVEVTADQLEALTASLLSIEGMQLTVNVEDMDGVPVPTGSLVQLSVVGNDRPGIVAEISRVFSELHINVENIETQCTPAPMSGDRLFQAEASLQLPQDISAASLRERLEELAADLMVDIKLSES